MNLSTDLAPATLPARPSSCRFDFMEGGVRAGTVLAHSQLGYAIQAAVNVAGQWVDEEGHFLLVPKACVVAWGKMPPNWELERLTLMQSLFGGDESRWPPMIQYRLRGREAGGTVAHLHDHVRLIGSGGFNLELRAK